jgi:hypothetical protein
LLVPLKSKLKILSFPQQHLQQHTHIMVVVVLRLSAAEIKALGLELAGFHAYQQARTCPETKREPFHGSYEVPIWRLTQQTTQIAKAWMEKPNPRHFLMGLNWRKTYKTESQI